MITKRNKKAFYVMLISFGVSFIVWLVTEWRDYHIFRNTVINDISELKMISTETQKSVIEGNIIEMQRDIELKLWLTRLDQKLRDKSKQLEKCNQQLTLLQENNT